MMSLFLTAGLLGGCNALHVYTIDLPQGNPVNREMAARVKTGMTPAQVRYLLGSPMVTDTFNPDRWDYVYYLRALANFESDRDGLLQAFGQNIAYRDTANFHQSFDNLRELTTRFPTSPYAGDARQRMIWLRNQFAESEMHVARYYLKRGTLISALNRARWVVENYPQTPQTPEALAMTVYCYQKLGTPDLADSSLALLRANYPDYVDARGRVRIDLGPQNEKRSWLNMATFGLIGSRDVDTRADDVPAANPPPPKAQ